MFYPTEVTYSDYGVPQGGIISPLIINFVLNGIEGAAFEGCRKSHKIKNSFGKDFIIEHNWSLIRYAYDFIIVLVNITPEIPNIVVVNIEKFLKIRGLKLN